MKYVTIIKVGVCQPIPHFDVIEGCSPSGVIVVTVVSFEPVLVAFERNVQAFFKVFVLHPVVVLPLGSVNGSSGIAIDQQRLLILRFKIFDEKIRNRHTVPEKLSHHAKSGDDVKDIERGKKRKSGDRRL